jgi:hypothetical protein
MSDIGLLDRNLAASPVGPSGVGEADEEPTLHHHLIAWRSLELPLRVLTGAVAAGIVAGAVMLALHGRFSAPISLLPTAHGAVTIPTDNFAAARFLALAGFALFVVGILETRWLGRAVLLASITILLTAVEAGRMPFRLFANCLAVGGAWAAIASFGAVVARRLRLSARRRYLLIGSWLLVSVAPAWPLFERYLPFTFFGFIVLLTPLIFLSLLAGTDWAEIADTFSQWTAKTTRLRKDHFSISIAAAIGALACAAIALGHQHISAAEVLRMLFAGSLKVAAVALALHLARFRGNWPMHFEWLPLALTGAVFVVIWLLLITPIDFHADPRADLLDTIALYMIAFASAAGLVACGRTQRLSRAGPLLLFVVVVCLSIRNPETEQLYMIAGLTTPLALVWLWRQRTAVDLERPLALLFSLNWSLVLLYGLVHFVYEGLSRMCDAKAEIAGVVICAALLWDLFASGHSTNGDGALFPRRARVLLFLSYVALATSAVIFFDSLTESTIHKPIFDPEYFIKYGLLIFGPATSVTLFVLRFGAWYSRGGVRSRSAFSSTLD